MTGFPCVHALLRMIAPSFQDFSISSFSPIPQCISSARSHCSGGQLSSPHNPSRGPIHRRPICDYQPLVGLHGGERTHKTRNGGNLRSRGWKTTRAFPCRMQPMLGTTIDAIDVGENASVVLLHRILDEMEETKRRPCAFAPHPLCLTNDP